MVAVAEKRSEKRSDVIHAVNVHHVVRAADVHAVGVECKICKIRRATICVKHACDTARKVARTRNREGVCVGKHILRAVDLRAVRDQPISNKTTHKVGSADFCAHVGAVVRVVVVVDDCGLVCIARDTAHIACALDLLLSCRRGNRKGAILDATAVCIADDTAHVACAFNRANALDVNAEDMRAVYISEKPDVISRRVAV